VYHRVQGPRPIDDVTKAILAIVNGSEEKKTLIPIAVEESKRFA